MNGAPPSPFRPRPARAFSRRALGYLVVLLAIGVFAAGYLVGVAATADGDANLWGALKEQLSARSQPNPELLDHIWDQISASYLRQPVDDQALFYGALAGLVDSLGDPYSLFLDPEDSQEFDDAIAGTFEGIGAEIGVKDSNLVIIAALPGTPAQTAGLKARDRILLIDDHDTRNLALDEAVHFIRGERGTVVELTILREGTNEPIVVSVTRDTITVESVSTSTETLPDGRSVLRVELVSFGPDTENDLVTALAAADGDRAGTVLDVRGNPGGYLDAAIGIASLFLSPGTPVVIKEYGDGTRETFEAGASPFADAERPLVVLVDGGAASASEIVAGALADADRATLIGETTFGKGTVQELTDLPGGSALKLTVARWLTPTGHSIDEQGITPDVEVELTAEDIENDRDPQLDRALEVLAGQ